MKLSRKILIIIACFFLASLVFGYYRFHQPYFPAYGKGGVGVAGKGCHILTDTKRNEIIYDNLGKVKWIGKPISEEEIVIFDGVKVVSFSWSELTNRSLVIRFTPERIYIYNLRKFTGGYYFRWNE